MKKILALVLVIAVTLGFAACGQAEPAEPEVKHIDVFLDVNPVPGEAMEIGTFTGCFEDGSTAWTYETEPVFVGMYDTIFIIGEADGKCIFGLGETICALNIEDGSLAWTNEEYRGQGTLWDFDEDDNLYLSAGYGPILMVIDPDGNTVYRHDDIYYEFSDGEKSVVSDYYAPYTMSLAEDGLVKIALGSTQTMVEVDPAAGIVKSEYVYTEPVDKEFLVGSWMLYDESRLLIDIAEDMSFTMFISDYDGVTQYIYCGDLDLGMFDPVHSEGLDYIRFVLDSEKTAAYADGSFADPYFTQYDSAGDYVVKWCDSYAELDVLCLGQVNNGDSVCSWYLDESYLNLHKVDLVG